jgi:hypothetical protein
VALSAPVNAEPPLRFEANNPQYLVVVELLVAVVVMLVGLADVSEMVV